MQTMMLPITSYLLKAEVPTPTILEDPAPYSASDEIERMIAKGKEAVGTGKYIWGGGHRGSLMDSDDFDFKQLLVDCSGFIGAVFGKGLGIDLGLGLEFEGVPTTHEYFTERYEPFTKTGVTTFEQVERGDIIVNRDRTHVVIYLGMDDGNQPILLDSSARDTLESEELGAEAKLGGVGIRLAESDDFDINLVLDTQKIIDEGEDILWSSVPYDELEDELSFLLGMNPSIRDMSNYQPTDDVTTTLYTDKKPQLLLALISIILFLTVTLLSLKMKKPSKQQKGVKTK